MKKLIFYNNQEITEFYKYLSDNIKDIELISIDTETDSLDISVATIYQIPIAIKFKNGIYESFLIDIYKLLKNQTILKETKILLKNIFVFIQNQQKIHKYKVIFHNVKYDGGVLKNFLDFIVEFEYIEDTLLLAQNLQRGYFWNTPFDIGMTFSLKTLSEKLGLKKKSQEGFSQIYKALEESDWDTFYIHFNQYVLSNQIKLNKFEQQKLLEKDIEWFTMLFFTPEELVNNLKKTKKQYITNVMQEFLENRKMKYAKQYNLYKNKSYTGMINDYKNPYNRDEMLEEFLKEFNEFYFKIPRTNYSSYYAYEISYLELYEISSLVLSTYALMDGKLTILLYEEIQSRLQKWLNTNMATKQERLDELKKIDRNYKVDKTLNYGLIMSEENGYSIDIDYVLKQAKELKDAIYEDTLLQNKFLIPILNYYIKDKSIPFIRKQENIKRDVGITLIEGDNYVLDESILRNNKNSILDIDIDDDTNNFVEEVDEEGVFQTLKPAESDKNKDFFKEYLSYVKLPTHVAKDPNKLDTYKKFLRVMLLKKEDNEVYEELITNRFNETSLPDARTFFTIINPLYEKIKKEFSKLYTYGIIDTIQKIINNFIRGDENIFEDIGSKWRCQIYENFSNIIDKIANKLLEQKMEYEFQKIEREYVEGLPKKIDLNDIPKSHINKLSSLKRKFVKEYFTLNENSEVNKLFDSINAFVLTHIDKLFENNIIMDEGVPETFKKDSIGSINPYIKSLNISFKFPKRTLNKETIQKLMDNKKQYLSNPEWDDEQRLGFESLIEYLLLKKKLSTYMKYYGNYAWNFIKAYATNKDKKIKFFYNNLGAFTGRLSGNGQQMPNAGVTAYSNPKYTLFNPRQAIIPSNKDNFMFTCDLTNIENVTMAEGTIRYGFMDEALVKIYAPYGAVNEKGELFNFKQHRYIINQHEWFYNNNVKWEPSDLHTETTKAAFPKLYVDLNAEVTMVNPLTGVAETLQAYIFASLFRKKVAKPINFGYPYGQSLNGMILANPNVPKELIEKIYYTKQKVFFNTDRLKQTLSDQANNDRYIYNIVGRRYVFTTDSFGRTMHSFKALNYYSQGSAADVLKMAIKKIELYLRHANTDIQMNGNVHDEVLLEGTYSPQNMEHMLRIFRLMGSYNVFSMPVTAGLEIIFDNWYAKKEVDIDGFYNMSMNKDDKQLQLNEIKPFTKDTPEFEVNKISTKVFNTLMAL